MIPARDSGTCFVLIIVSEWAIVSVWILYPDFVVCARHKVELNNKSKIIVRFI